MKDEEKLEGWMVMIILAWVAGILCFIIIVIAFIQVRINIDYKHHQDDDELTIDIFAIGLLIKTINVPIMAFDEEHPSFVFEEKTEQKVGKDKDKKARKTFPEIIEQLKLIKMWLEHIVALHNIMRRFLKRVKVREISWESTFGMKDACLTGSLTGLIWTLKGSVIGLMSSYMKLKCKPHLFIQPVFNRKISETRIQCMISFRLGHAMITALILIRHIKGNLFSLLQESKKRKSSTKEASV